MRRFTAIIGPELLVRREREQRLRQYPCSSPLVPESRWPQRIVPD
jgi:hypothetical protein